MRTGEETVIDTDPALIPLQSGAAGPSLIPPVVVPPTGAISTIDGMVGPNLTINTAAPVNGLAVTKTSLANIITLGLSGVGTMAQRNAIAAIADLNQTISNPPTQAEVQAISDKIDELFAAMRTANHLTP